MLSKMNVPGIFIFCVIYWLSSLLLEADMAKTTGKIKNINGLTNF